MIISLRGTSGAGKSWIVHQIIAQCTVTKIAYPTEGKRRPMGLLLALPGRAISIFVPGHYDIANGGVDTLSDLSTAYKLIEEHAKLGLHVLYEGKNMSDGSGRLLTLVRAGMKCHVLHLSTSLDECVRRVRSRGHAIASSSIKKTRDKIQRDCDKFVRAGVCVDLARSGAALRLVREWLELPQ
jgi:hypothetical protein